MFAHRITLIHIVFTLAVLCAVNAMPQLHPSKFANNNNDNNLWRRVFNPSSPLLYENILQEDNRSDDYPDLIAEDYRNSDDNDLKSAGTDNVEEIDQQLIDSLQRNLLMFKKVSEVLENDLRGNHPRENRNKRDEPYKSYVADAAPCYYKICNLGKRRAPQWGK